MQICKKKEILFTCWVRSRMRELVRLSSSLRWFARTGKMMENVFNGLVQVLLKARVHTEYCCINMPRLRGEFWITILVQIVITIVATIVQQNYVRTRTSRGNTARQILAYLSYAPMQFVAGCRLCVQQMRAKFFMVA